MKHTLIVTTRYPFYAQSGARRRLESIARLAGLEGPVDLLCFAPSGGRVRDPEAEGALFRDVHLVPFRLFGAATGISRSVLAGGSLQEGLFVSGAIVKWLRTYSGDYDISIFHLLRAGQYLSASRSARRVLELTDAISLAHAREAEGRRGPLAALHRFEARRVLAAERAQGVLADAIVLVSDIDRAYLAAEAPELAPKLAVIPLSVPDALFHTRYQPSRPSACLVGAMWFAPNIRGCEWFISEVVPKLVACLPDFRFEIVGAGPPAVLQRFADAPGVVVHGFVPDVPPVVMGCIASITPALSGSGLQTKLVESLAMGLPALCSPLAAEPLRSWAGDALGVCATADDYVQQFLALVESEPLRTRRSMTSRERARNAVHESLISESYRALL
jgi:glycosyltransferase involved in cell wall biosynthesis